jgi:hypothetical protein
VVSDSGNYARPKLLESHGLGLFLKDHPTTGADLFKQLGLVLKRLDEISKLHSTDLIVLLFPQRFQVQPQDWQATLDIYGLKEPCFDLEQPAREILTFCEESGLRCIDMTGPLRAAYENSKSSLYLPRHDMHWNSLGHRSVANILTPLFDGLL